MVRYEMDDRITYFPGCNLHTQDKIDMLYDRMDLRLWIVINSYFHIKMPDYNLNLCEIDTITILGG